MTLQSQVCTGLLNFAVVPIFIESILTFAENLSVLVLLKANCDTSSRKLHFSITLLRGSHIKQRWAAERTFTMSGYLTSLL